MPKEFSGKERSQSLISKPDFFSGKGRHFRTFGTGFSTATDGNVTIDPSIRSIQEQGLSRINNLYNQTGAYGDELIGNTRNLRTQSQERYNELLGNTRSLRERFLGNQSAYANAQLNPLRQQIAAGRGELQRDIGLRGISGSSFGEQATTAYDLETQRRLQDAMASVENQQLQALQGIDAQQTQQVAQELQAITGVDSQLTSQMFGKVAQQAQLNGESLDIAKARLAQELSALGIGQAQINTMVQAFEGQQNRAFQERKAIADSITSFFKPGGGGPK